MFSFQNVLIDGSTPRGSHSFFHLLFPGVGPMTVAMLLYNTVLSAKRVAGQQTIQKVRWI